jgi:hypothetical protein
MGSPITHTIKDKLSTLKTRATAIDGRGGSFRAFLMKGTFMRAFAMLKITLSGLGWSKERRSIAGRARQAMF